MSQLRPKETLRRKLHGDAESELRRRLYFMPTPTARFDPLKASAQELFKYGLPPRPGRNAPPQARELWHQMMSAPLEILPVVFPSQIPDDYRLTYSSVSFGGRQETSKNWSGASIAEFNENGFIQVWGSWRVPNPSPPTINGSPAVPGDYRCSTWVGIGGLRSFSLSLPQIGTTQIVVLRANGAIKRKFHAWWQWWLRGSKYGPVHLPSVPVHAGDLIICHLTVLASDHVQLFIKNQTTGHFYPIDAHAPTIPVPIPFPIPVPITLPRTEPTAEWITERPTKKNSSDLYPLPDYGSVEFEGCVAVAGPDLSSPIYPRTLAGARLIRMLEIRNNPLRTAVISTANKKAEDKAETNYCGNIG